MIVSTLKNIELISHADHVANEFCDGETADLIRELTARLTMWTGIAGDKHAWDDGFGYVMDMVERGQEYTDEREDMVHMLERAGIDNRSKLNRAIGLLETLLGINIKTNGQLIKWPNENPKIDFEKLLNTEV